MLYNKNKELVRASSSDHLIGCSNQLNKFFSNNNKSNQANFMVLISSSKTLVDTKYTEGIKKFFTVLY